MRIVYLMYCSSMNFMKCSTYNWAKGFIRSLVDRGHYVYWCAPKRCAEEAFKKEPQFTKHERIKFIDIDSRLRLDGHRAYHYLSAVEDKFFDLFAQHLGGRLYYDAVITNRILSTSYLRNQLLIPIAPHRLGIETPIYNVFLYIFSPDNPTGKDFDHYEEALASSVLGAYNVFEGKLQEEMTKKAVSRYLSPYAMKKAFSKKNVIYGISNLSGGRLDKFVRSVEEKRKNKKFTINWATAESGIYKFSDAVEQVGKMFQRGRNVKFLVTATTACPNGIPEHLLTHDGIERYAGLSQEQFWEKIQDAHVALMENREGEVSMSLQEQIYLGLLPVLPKRNWVKSVVPDGYPFLYKNTNELNVILRYLETKYYTDPQIPKLVEECQKLMKKRTSEIVNQRFIETIENEVNKRIEHQFYPSFVTFIEPLLKDKKHFTYQEWRDFIKDNSKNGLDIDKLRASYTFSSRLSYYWFMKKLGWIDECTSLMPSWRKE